MRWQWAVLGAAGILVWCVIFLAASSPAPSVEADEEERLQPIHAVAFCPDGRRLVTLNQGGPLRAWDLATGKEVKRFKLQGTGAIAVAVSPDGRFVAGSSNRPAPEKYGTQLWDISTGEEISRFVGHDQWVNSIAFTPDGRRMLSVSGDRTVRIWDVGTGREIHCLRGHQGDVNAVVATPDGRFALSAGGDYWGGQLHDPTVRLWDLQSGMMVRIFHGHTGAVNDVAVSPDGRLAASVSWDGTARIWDVAGGRQIRSCQGPPSAAYNAVAFAPDGKSLLTGSEGPDAKVQLWDVATGRELRVFGVKSATYDVAFSPDGHRAVSGQGRLGHPASCSGLLPAGARRRRGRRGDRSYMGRRERKRVVASRIGPASIAALTGRLVPARGSETALNDR